MSDLGATWDAPLDGSATQASSARRAMVAGRYEIEGLIGAGGMGSVYRAFDRELDEPVALKVLNRALVADPTTLERFRREVKLARRVTHPNVARVYDIGEHEGDRFLSMELIEGESLAAALLREIALPPARVVEIAIAVCEGLGAAHAVGVVHRDLKPDNVMLGKGGRVVLTDFGIARLAGGAASRTLGFIAGTPLYMAPEQVDGLGEIDGRADLYALGVMLYEMLTGEPAWTGESAIAIAARRLVSDPPEPTAIADVPEALAAVVRRCMARAPSARFRTADDARAALLACGRLEARAALPLALRPTQPPAARTPRNARVVALLPVKNTGSPGDEHFAQTFGAALCDVLAAHPAISVRTARGGSGNGGDVRARGRDLGAEIVVTPSLRITPEGGARAAIRVVSVAEGLQLWAGRVDRPLAQLFDLAGDCSARVAAALVIDPPARAPAGPGDAAVVDLLARAHGEAASPELGANDRAVALLERAIAAGASDYWTLSAYASVLARRVEDGDGIVEEALEARAMAERAIAIAPGAMEARVALARVQLELGAPDEAAATLRFKSETGHALFQRTRGLLLADAGRLDEATAHLARAAALREPRGRWDEARVRALAGALTSADAILDADRSQRSSDYFVAAARVALWRRDAARLAALDATLRERPVARRDVLLAYVATSQGNVVETHARLEAQARAAGDLPRRRALWHAMAAEAAAYAGDRDRAVASLEHANASRLADVAWLERCPLLEIVRSHPTFASVLAAARARVAPALLAPTQEDDDDP